MIKITLEKEKILRSLKELESEFNKGKIPQRHYEVQKRQLEERLEAFEVANRVRRLQGKETAEVPLDEEENTEEENEELFKKYITSPGLKEKKLEKPKEQGRISQNKMIGIALLAAAFLIGIVFGSFNIDLPTDAANANLFTNESAFPPYVLNNTTNTTNMTNMTNTTKNATNIVKNTTVPKPKPTNNTQPKPPEDPSENNTGGAGDPGTTKTIKNTSNYN